MSDDKVKSENDFLSNKRERNDEKKDSSNLADSKSNKNPRRFLEKTIAQSERRLKRDMMLDKKIEQMNSKSNLMSAANTVSTTQIIQERSNIVNSVE
jgi:transcription elongation GreA/GreB family factor